MISSKLPTDRFPAKIIDAFIKWWKSNPLDGGNYTVFGQVIDGMDVVDKIDDKDKTKNRHQDWKIEILKDYNFKNNEREPRVLSLRILITILHKLANRFIGKKNEF